MAFGIDHCIVKPISELHVNVSLELLLNKLSIHPPYNLASMEEVVRSFTELFYDIKGKKSKLEFRDIDLFNETDMNILKNLKSNNDIIICKPDKGRGTVILDKANYVEKMNVILNEQNNFEKLSYQEFPKHTLNLEDRANRPIKDMKNKGTISENEYKSLYITGGGPGIMYGLPKTHKPNIPMKPVVSSIGTSFYKLAKFLIPEISQYATNEYTLHNSYDFFDNIRHMNLKNKYIVSMDIECLYTNIPVRETIDILTNLIYENDNSFRNMSKLNFKKMLECITSNTFFIFNNIYYKQRDGLAMGSPLSATLANIFLCFHERKWIDECPLTFKPQFYRRYMDDTFIIFDNANQANEFLRYMNERHPKINFTIERERDNKLPFLDLLIDKSDVDLDISIYRKQTYTDLGVNFLSACNMKYKLNTFNTFFYRAYKLTSNYLNFHKEITYLENFFKNNGFHPNLFYKQLRQFLNKRYNTRSPTYVPKKLEMYLRFPYLSNKLNYYLQNKLRNIVHKYYPQIQLTLAFYNNNKIRNYCNHKDKLESKNLSMVVYKFICPSCHLLYIGSTIKTLEQRVFEHFGSSFRTRRPLTLPVQSSIRDHCHSICECNFTIKDFCILYRGNYKEEIRIAESLFIKRLDPSLNLDTSSVPLRIE